MTCGARYMVTDDEGAALVDGLGNAWASRDVTGRFARFRRWLPVVRFAPGAYVDGFWQEGAEIEDQIFASAQPASQIDMNLLPEGRRLTGGYRLYTCDTLLLARGDQQADRVTINGDQYEVMAEAVWQNNIINHNSYLVARIVDGT